MRFTINLNRSGFVKYKFLKNLFPILGILSAIDIIANNSSIVGSILYLPFKIERFVLQNSPGGMPNYGLNVPQEPIEQAAIVEDITLIVLGIFIWLMLTYLIALIQSKKYSVHIDNSKLHIKSGVIQEKRHISSIDEITDYQEYSGILEKIAGIKIIIIKTAGEQSLQSIIAPKNPENVLQMLSNNLAPEAV